MLNLDRMIELDNFRRRREQRRLSKEGVSLIPVVRRGSASTASRLMTDHLPSSLISQTYLGGFRDEHRDEHRDRTTKTL